MPQKDRPYPFYWNQTDWYKIYPEERAKLEKWTGIDGPNHKHWNTMDVSSLPDKVCPCCGSKFHTPGWCDKLWSQTSTAQETKGDLFVESRRRMLNWNKPSQEQLATLNAVIQSAPSREEALAALAQDPATSQIISQSDLLCDVCEAAPEDQGASLFALVQEWSDPRNDS